MALESTVLTAPGTLIIAPPAGESTRLFVRRTGQEDGQQPQQRSPQPLSETILRRGNTETFADADKFREQKSPGTGSSFQGQLAVDAYQSLAIESRRDEIKQLMGVDTYA